MRASALALLCVLAAACEDAPDGAADAASRDDPISDLEADSADTAERDPLLDPGSTDGADGGPGSEDCFHPELPRWRVCDGNLHDPDGRRVILRGVNVSQARKHAPYEGGTSAAEIAAIRAFGFNQVRLLWSWAAAMPEPGTLDDDYLDRVAAEVVVLEEAGLLVVLDAHQDLFGEAIRSSSGPVGNGAPVWACPEEIAETFTEPVQPWFANYAHEAVQGCFDNLLADTELQDQFAAAWAALAERVAGSPAVVGYDLWNEPFWGSQNLFSWEADWLLPLYERLGAAILAVDPDAVFFVEPGANKNVSSRSSLPRPSFESVVYAPHLYNATMEGGGAWNGDLEPFEDRLSADAAERDAWENAGYFVGEWGTPGRNGEQDGAFLSAAASLLDAEQLSWSVWQLGPGTAGSYALVDTELEPLPHALGLARSYVERVAGDELVFAYDAATGELTASWRAQLGLPTVISAPALVWPDGYDVAVTGGQHLASHDTSRIQILADDVGTAVGVVVTPR